MNSNDAETALVDIASALTSMIDQGADDQTLLDTLDNYSLNLQLLIIENADFWARRQGRRDVLKRLDVLMNNTLISHGYSPHLPTHVIDEQGQLFLELLTFQLFSTALESRPSRGKAIFTQEKVLNIWESQHVSSPPGTRLLKVADFFFSPDTVKLTFEPLVADWRQEYFDALNGYRFWKARWIYIRYYWYFAKAFGLSKILNLIKGLIGIPLKK